MEKEQEVEFKGFTIEDRKKYIETISNVLESGVKKKSKEYKNALRYIYVGYADALRKRDAFIELCLMSGRDPYEESNKMS